MNFITDYPKVQELAENDTFIVDGPEGTKGILAGDLAKALAKRLTSKEFMENFVISELDEVDELTGENVLMIGTADGNKKIPISEAAFDLIDPVISLETRRNLWRGKNLGNTVTAEQYARIKDGTFRGLFLGDYWFIKSKYFRILDFDYWLGSGDTPCTTHHLVIMPDEVFYTTKMNDTDTTEGGYVGSKMYQENLAEAKTIINGAFGQNHILIHREYLTNAVTNGYPSAGAWYDSTVELPNEIMMYGSYIHTPAGNGSFVPNRYTIDKTQLAGMKARPLTINPKRQTQWLRDVISRLAFAYVHYDGRAHYLSASSIFGVRPVFGLIG